MAVQKSKKSRQKRNKRKNQKKIKMTEISIDTSSGEHHIRHNMTNNFFYKGIKLTMPNITI